VPASNSRLAGGSTAVLIAGFAVLGLVNFASARAYELGKQDATKAVAPYGVVLVDPDGTCRVYDQPGDVVTVDIGTGLAHLTTVVRLQR